MVLFSVESYKCRCTTGVHAWSFVIQLYVNDLNYFVSNTSLRLYADDRTECTSDPSPMVLQYVIDSDQLSVLSSWFKPNYLKIDAALRKQLPLGHLYEYEFHFNNRTVETHLDTLKILGVILDSKLNFKAHIKEQLKIACAKASALRRLRTQV